MALLLDLWSALILGILYLTFQAFPIIFGEIHHFEMQFVGLTFLGIGIGMLGGLAVQPYFNRQVLSWLSSLQPSAPVRWLQLDKINLKRLKSLQPDPEACMPKYKGYSFCDLHIS